MNLIHFCIITCDVSCTHDVLLLVITCEISHVFPVRTTYSILTWDTSYALSSLLSPLSHEKLTYLAKSFPSMATQHNTASLTLVYHLYPDRNCPNTIIILLSYF